MCGRYSLFAPPKDLEERFDAVFDYPYERRYNAAPSQFLPVITDESPESIQAVEWGLIPTWAEDADHASINARAETLADKSSFRDAFAGVDADIDTEGAAAGRCLVLADGFFEWTGTADGKRPFRVARQDGAPFAMAGLWTRWQPPTAQTGLGAFSEGTGDAAEDAEPEPRETFTIVTTEPNDVVAELHDRMAAILQPDDERDWLTASQDEASKLLDPIPADELRAYPVSRAVNDPSNDSKAVVDEVEVPDQ